MLIEQPLELADTPIPEQAIELIERGRALFKAIDSFGFVPSDYHLAWRALGAFKGNRFCEWGSGMGIVTGLAEILGFDARGIELADALAATSRRLLAELGLNASIETGDYLESATKADVYYVYCWPGKIAATEAHFDAIAPQSAKLLICYGQSDIRCKTRLSTV